MIDLNWCQQFEIIVTQNCRTSYGILANNLCVFLELEGQSYLYERKQKAKYKY